MYFSWILTGLTCILLMLGKTYACCPDEDDNFEEDFVYKQNIYRNNHYTPPLTYNEEVSKTAQMRANEIAGIKNDKTAGTGSTFDKNIKETCGENVFTVFFQPIKLTEASLASWYNESLAYRYDEEPNNSRSEHFTQMMWVNSKEVGVGRATKGLFNALVAIYCPKGNVQGEYRYNVRKSDSDD